MKIIKVFTRYDPIFSEYHMAKMKHIEASPLKEDTILDFNEPLTEDITLKLSYIEHGLEGVKFVHYEEGE